MCCVLCLLGLSLRPQPWAAMAAAEARPFTVQFSTPALCRHGLTCSFSPFFLNLAMRLRGLIRFGKHAAPGELFLEA